MDDFFFPMIKDEYTNGNRRVNVRKWKYEQINNRILYLEKMFFICGIF
jgi:hypothetical protein